MLARRLPAAPVWLADAAYASVMGKGDINAVPSRSSKEPMGRLSAPCPAAGLAGLQPLVWRATQGRDADWVGYGNGHDEQRFVPVAQIDDKNVGQLGLVWSLDLDEQSALAATPIEVGGTLYFSGAFGHIYAVDARTGRLLWTYDPQANEAAPRDIRRAWATNRGVAYADGRIFVATRDCRMVAVDARTGKLVWQSSFLVPGSNSTSTGAPRAFKGKVIIGNSGSEFGSRGYVTAFDAKTGKLAWRFFTVPGDPAKGFENDAMAMAAKSWSGEWWKYGGGGTPWNAITFDESFNQILIGTGNGGPWNNKFRSNDPKGQDNLFLASVVAVDADSGAYKWHYQYNPNEVWDYKATADIILADIAVQGKTRKVMMQAPTNGFFYVIDRADGKLISAGKIGKVTWADHIDLATGRPVERPGIRGEKGAAIIYPDNYGAHNWQAMSYNPRTGLAYIPYMQSGMKYGPALTRAEAVDVDPNEKRISFRIGAAIEPMKDPGDRLDGKGSLLAWDPVAQKVRWRVDYPTSLNAGTLTTGGNLVFQGTNTGKLYAYSATTGERLWSFDTKLGIIAPPISYSVDGRQYLSILVGYGAMGGMGGPGHDQGWKYGLQPRRLLSFALGGKANLPATPPPDFVVHKLDDPRLALDPKRVRTGAKVYAMLTCGMCHGAAAIASGNAPDLRESGVALDRSAFKEILKGGALVSRGMPLFDDLSDREIEDLYQYIRARARARDTEQAR